MKYIWAILAFVFILQLTFGAQAILSLDKTYPINDKDFPTFQNNFNRWFGYSVNNNFQKIEQQSNNWLNQAVKTTSSPSFAAVTVNGTLKATSEALSGWLTVSGTIGATGLLTAVNTNTTGVATIETLRGVSANLTGTATLAVVDINGGTADSLTALTVANNIDIGSFSLRASSVEADSLTSGRVPFASTNGLLIDDSDLTFAENTLTASKLITTTLEATNVGTPLTSDTDITDDLGEGTKRWKDIYASTLNTGQTATNTLKLRGRDTDAGTWQDFLTITAAAIPVMSIDGEWDAAGQTCDDLGAVTTCDINGGTIDGTSIGASSSSTALFSTVGIGGALISPYLNSIVVSGAGSNVGGLRVNNTNTNAANHYGIEVGVSGANSSLNIGVYSDVTGATTNYSWYSSTGQMLNLSTYSNDVGAVRTMMINSTGLMGYNSSSRKFKENILDMGNVDWIYQLRPVTYNRKKDTKTIKTIEYGLIAEEVALVNDYPVVFNASGEAESIEYYRLVPVLLKAIQDLKKEIEVLKAK